MSEITGLFFEDLLGDQDLEITDGGIYFTNEIPAVVRFATTTSGESESMKFSISGALNIFHTENIPPYTYPGGNPTPLALEPGEYTINLMLFPEDHLGGTMCDQETFSFTILERCFIQEAYVAAAGANGQINFENNDVICITDLPSQIDFGIEMAGSHESVQLEVLLDGEVINTRLDTQEPYRSGSIDLVAGTYTINVLGFGENVPGEIPCNQRTYVLEIQECTDCPTAPFEGGQIQAGSCTDDSFTINNLVAPYYNNQALEIVWIQALNSPECAITALQLIGTELSEEYDNFIDAGGFGIADPTIIGTSWSFVRDNNANDLQLTVNNIEGEACFMRFARMVDCEEFFANAGPVSIDSEDCLSCTGTASGGSISATDCDEEGRVFINNVQAPGANGAPTESIWIRTIGNDCTNADAELAGLDIGTIYTNFLNNGGFGVADPSLGNTSWDFVRDNNTDDLQFTVEGFSQTACYKRLSRIAGCEDFSGSSNSAFVDASDCFEMDCNLTFYGGAIEAGDCNDTGTFIISNAQSPQAGGMPTESIWLRSTLGNCDLASGQLTGFNVGELYDAFIEAGGFEVADPGIPGTSWEFVTDMDGDDLTLIVNQMEGISCFTRCTRLVGCQRLMGESNFVTVSCISTLNDPVTFKLCHNELALKGISENSVYFVKVYDHLFSDILYENNNFNGDYTELEHVDLPDGVFVLDVLLLESSYNEQFRITEKFSLPATCIDPLVGESPEIIITVETLQGEIVAGQAEQEPVELATMEKESLAIFPNPVHDKVYFYSPSFNSQKLELQIVNNLGQIVYSRVVDQENQGNRVMIEVDPFKNGIYFAQFRIGAQKTLTGKFIVSKNVIK